MQDTLEGHLALLNASYRSSSDAGKGVRRISDIISSHLCVRFYHQQPSSKSEVLYDITSVYFEGEYDESEMITLGYSRDKRLDKEQINIGLNLSLQGGIPIYHQVLVGNTSDKTTIEKNMKALRRVFPII